MAQTLNNTANSRGFPASSLRKSLFSAVARVLTLRSPGQRQRTDFRFCADYADFGAHRPFWDAPAFWRVN